MDELFVKMKVKNDTNAKDNYVIVKKGNHWEAIAPSELLGDLNKTLFDMIKSNNDLSLKVSALAKENLELKKEIEKLHILNAYSRMMADIALGLIDEPQEFEKVIAYLDSDDFKNGIISDDLVMLKLYEMKGEN